MYPPRYPHFSYRYHSRRTRRGKIRRAISIAVMMLSVFGWLAMFNAIVRAGVTPPQVSVSPASAYEGDSATTALKFRIVGSGPVCAPISVDWTTVDGNATSPSDFTAASGTATLRPADPTVVHSFTVGSGDVHGMAIGPEGDIWIVDLNYQSVSRYDRQGALVRTWGLGLADARSIAVSDSGFVYVGNVANSRVEKFDSSGVYVRSFDLPGTPGVSTQPTGVAVDAQENLYVSAESPGRLIKFDPDGNVVFERATVDARPYDIAIGSNGNVYVDVWERFGTESRVQVFSPTGDSIAVWNPSSTGGRLWTSELAVDGSGNVFIAENNRIVIADENGTFLAEWFGVEVEGSPLRYPFAIAADGAGNVFVNVYEREGPTNRIVHLALTTAADVVVAVHGDTAYESSESFTLELSNPQNAVLVSATAIGTIGNDDANVGPNLVTNASFDSSAGWAPYCSGTACTASWALVAEGHNGPGAALVSGGPSPHPFGLNDSPDWITAAELEGARYRFSAWVKLMNGAGTARLRIREYSDSLGQSQPREGTTTSSPIVLDSTWQRITVSVLVVFERSHLDLQILMDPTAAGAQFMIDDVAIERLFSNTEPVVLAPARVVEGWHRPIEVDVHAYDPDGDPITSLTASAPSLPPGNNASFEVRPDRSEGIWSWTPGSAAPRYVPYPVTFTASNGQSASAQTHVVVTSNLAHNVTFAQGTEGWVGSRANLSSVPGRIDGTALRVTSTSDIGTFGLNDSPDRALSTGAGSQYTFNAWVRTASPDARGYLWVREYDSEGNLLRSSHRPPSTIGPDWQRLEMTYGTEGVGSTLNFSVVMLWTTPGDAFDVDDISFEATDLIVASVPDPATRVTAQLVAPNPMRESAWLRLSTSRPGALRARLYDLSGRVVRTLADVQHAVAGEHAFALDRKDARGRSLAAGMYFYRVESADGSRNGRVVVLH